MSNRLSIGDVFEVDLAESLVGFFQYVARDSSQLNSHVVRVFRERFKRDENPDAGKIVRGEVEFYAHVFVSVGVKQGYWKKVAREDIVGDVDVLFRNSSDYGKSKEKTSDSWFVWKIDGPYKRIGPLSAPYRSAEIGVVVPPDSLVYRMAHGVYDFFYPEPA
ncbi:hypothetical protein [Pseudoxanthomonas winnipegensis]|uniref:hypothetical protein n=1 Tax=Pseudoxanthomonas winnipegensis TaxID=2480810 RepID=UPI0030F3F297